MNKVGRGVSLMAIALSLAAVEGAHASPVRAVPCVTTSAGGKWSTLRLAAQTLAIPVDQGGLSAASGVVARGVGGVLLTGSSPHNLGAAIAALSSAEHPVAPIFMTDEEGGAVQRLSAVLGNMPSARQMGATMSPAGISSLARKLGTKMVSLGITMDLAPVLDLDGGAGPSATDPDGTRSFSPNVAVASRDGIAFARGLEAAGVTPVLKHFPGLGGSTGNTDFAVASTRPWAALSTTGLAPFATGIAEGLPAVMVADAIVPGLTSVPAALSPVAVTSVLRRRLGFGGLVLSDSLSAPSIANAGYLLPAATVDALKAGVDMVLFDSSASVLAKTTGALIAAINSAVSSHDLSRSRLVDAATAVLEAKHALCAPTAN